MNFYLVITNRIRLEVNLAVDKALKAVNETKNDKNEFKMEDNYQKLLLEKMGKQIDFLQNELANKNEIIKTLINDKSVSNVNRQPKDESTIVPVKTKNLESNPSMELISN